VVEHTKLIGEEMAKLKTGQVYKMVRDDGSVEEFICWATLHRKGQMHGWIQRFGFARQMISEESELAKQMTAVLPPKPKAPSKPKASSKPRRVVAKKPPVKKAPEKASK